MALVWGGAACYNGHRVGDDFPAIGFMAQLATKKKQAKAWTSRRSCRRTSASRPVLCPRPITGRSCARLAREFGPAGDLEDFVAVNLGAGVIALFSGITVWDVE
jgi:hypothetical protein